MKKFLFFFSTLFVFLIPHVSAETETPLYIDYRTPGVTPYMVSSINAIKDTVCPSPECNELSQQVGHSVTVYEYTEKMIKDFEDAGYYIIVVATWNSTSNYFGVNRFNYPGFIYYVVWNSTSNYFGVNRFNYPGFIYYVVNTNKTELSDLSITLQYNSSENRYIYRLTDNGDINVYGWQGSSLNDVENKRDILGENGTFQSILFNFDGNDSYNLVNHFLYYSNIDLSYKFDYDGSTYPITVFHDWFSTSSSDSSVSINTGMGPATNKYLMLRSFIDEDNFFPPEEPEPTPDNPNQGIEDGLGDLNDSINSSDTSGAEDSFGGFFDNFDDNDYGLSDIIKTPLTFIQGLSTNTCTPITLPLPFVDQNLVLPCIRPIFEEHFSPLLTVYQLITFGLISYFIVINIFKTVRGFKNPDSNNVEVLEL